MANANSSKSQEHFDIADNDRISKFTDSILCHILSFLPTIHSVRTSILSRRWRFTWTYVSVLDLDDLLFQSDRFFKEFVNRVLILHSHPCVQRFRLNLHNSYRTSYVNLWNCAAITHNVQELDLSLTGMAKLPQALFNCGTIVVLKLAYGIDLDVPESVSLPSLKVVHFRYIHALYDDTIKRILFGSPILEELVIDRSSALEDGVKIFLILSSSLETLTIRSSSVFEHSNHYEVVIDAPKLKYLNFFDQRREVLLDSIELKNVPSIVTSVFQLPNFPCDPVPELRLTTWTMHKIHNVHVICPSFMLIKNLLPYPNIRLNNLTELLVNYCGEDLSRLPNILTKLPNLKVLKLEKLNRCNHTITCEGWEEKNTDEISCLNCSLKKIRISGFEMNEGDMQMVKYFLGNAMVLNEIRLKRRYGTGDPEESGFLDKLLAFPRCSNAFKLFIVT